MTTYKEQQENKKAYVLVKNCKVLGSFGNLKKLCDFVTDEDISYNTLIRKKDFPVKYKGYDIFKVKHY